MCVCVRARARVCVCIVSLLIDDDDNNDDGGDDNGDDDYFRVPKETNNMRTTLRVKTRKTEKIKTKMNDFQRSNR